MQMSNFDKQMQETFSPLKRIGIFKAAKVEEKFAYLFDKNHLPTSLAWYLAGEILLVSLWLIWFLLSVGIWVFGGNENIVVDMLLIRGDLLKDKGEIFSVFLIFLVGCAVLYFSQLLVAIISTYSYPVLFLVIWLVQMTKQKSTYWAILIFWGVFCFIFAMWMSKDQLRFFKIDGDWDFIPRGWTDWIDPDRNLLMLIIGYPVPLGIIGCMLIINIFYYKYKPENADKNWSAEGLDAHFLDGDADN